MFSRLLLGLLWLLHLLPLPALRALGALIGRLLYAFGRARRHVALTPRQIVDGIVQLEVPAMSEFHKVVLYTDTDGRARFREERTALDGCAAQARLSALWPSGGYQLRHSPVGFRSSFHCTGTPQWVFILSGRMQISLQDGSSRVFDPGQHFHSADTLPTGARFDDKLHGHWSRQVGDEPLVTLFMRG